MIRPTRGETIRYLEEFSRIIVDMDRKDLAAPLAPLAARFMLGVFRLVVVGEIKKGKTSFINALLGLENLLPTSSDVATSTVYKIYYGPKHAIKVFFRALPSDADEGKDDASTAPEPCIITAKELVVYGTEDGNPDNVKNVDFIAIEAPNPMLKSGLAIIDTPGLGGLFRKHADIAWRYIPNADAVFFALDSVEAVMSRDETEFLKRLRGFTDRLFFVQTKIDAAGEEQWQGWAERNQRIIADALDTPVGRHPYFPISAKLKLAADQRRSPRHLQRSGFIPLLDFIHQRLIPAKDALAGREVLRTIAVSAGALRKETEAQRAIAQADSREKLAALEKEFSDSKMKLAAWTQEQWPKAVECFQSGVTQISMTMQRQLSDRLDPGPMGAVVRRIIDPLRDDSSLTAQAVASRADEWQSMCTDLCAREILDIANDVQKSMRSLWFEALASILPEGAGPALFARGGGTIAISDRGEVHLSGSSCSWSEYALSALPALGTGVLVLTGVAASPLILVGTLTAAICGVWRTRQMKTERAAQQKRDVLAQLQSILSTVVQKAQRQAHYQIGDMITDVRKKILEMGNKATVDMRASMDDRMKEIQAARQRSSSENGEVAAVMEKRFHSLDALLKDIKRICSESTTGSAPMKGGDSPS